MDDKIEFKLTLIAVIYEVDSGIGVGVTYARVGGNISVPVLRIAASEVIADAWQAVEAGW